MRTPLFCLLSIFSPPVHIARWAHMRCFLSVCHTFKNLSLELYHSMYLPLPTFVSANGHCVIALTGRAHCQRQVAFLVHPIRDVRRDVLIIWKGFLSN